MFEGAPRRRLEGWNEMQEAAYHHQPPFPVQPHTASHSVPEIAALVSGATIEHRRTPDKRLQSYVDMEEMFGGFDALQTPTKGASASASASANALNTPPLLQQSPIQSPPLGPPPPMTPKGRHLDREQFARQNPGGLLMRLDATEDNSPATGERRRVSVQRHLNLDSGQPQGNRTVGVVQESPKSPVRHQVKMQSGNLVMGPPVECRPLPKPEPAKRMVDTLLSERRERQRMEAEYGRELQLARSLLQDSGHIPLFENLRAGEVPEGWTRASDLPDVVTMTEEEVRREIIIRGRTYSYIAEEHNRPTVSKSSLRGTEVVTQQARDREMLRDMRRDAGGEHGAPIPTHIAPSAASLKLTKAMQRDVFGRSRALPDTNPTRAVIPGALYQGREMPRRTTELQSTSQQRFASQLDFPRRGIPSATATSSSPAGASPLNASNSSMAMTGHLDTPPTPLPPLRPCRVVMPKINFLSNEEFYAKRKAEKEAQKPPTRTYNIIVEDDDGKFRCKEEGCAFVTSRKEALKEHRYVRHTTPERPCPYCGKMIKTQSFPKHKIMCQRKHGG